VAVSEYYRSFELPWEGDPESQRRFRRLVTIGLGLLLLLGLLLPLIHLPVPLRAPEEAVPERLARLMVEEKPKPPPPPPVEQPKPKPEVKPVEQPKPVDRVAEARKKAEHYMSNVKDELANLRRDVDLTPLGQTKNLSGAVGADSHAERSLIASKAGSGSSGITSANSSRGFGSGAGSLTGHETTAVSSRIAAIGNGSGVTRTGASGKPARSREEIELVFDRNKGAIYALYSRALRENPELMGKLVLEFTIAPTGEITMCRVVSSELNDPDLERKIVARVKLFQFEARDVATITTTKPIDFIPTS
jgi:protein TonB